MNDEIISRQFTKDDESLIYSSWLRSYWDLSISHQRMSKTTFYEYHPKLIEKKIRLADVLITCAKSEPTVILGYLVGEKLSSIPVIHYMYVKEAFRDEKICTQMLTDYVKDSTRIIVTHITNSNGFLHMFRKYDYDYVPYLF